MIQVYMIQVYMIKVYMIKVCVLIALMIQVYMTSAGRLGCAEVYLHWDISCTGCV